MVDLEELKEQLERIEQRQDLQHERETLQDLPDKIRTERRKLLRAKRKIDTLEQAKKEIEKTVMGEVSRETDDEGKKKYSNQSEREAEKWKRLVGDKPCQFKEEYQEIKEDLAEAYNTLHDAKAEYEYYKKVLRRIEATVDTLKVEESFKYNDK